MSDVVYRRSRPADHEALVALMQQGRVNYAGARHPAVYRAVVADSEGPDARIVIVVAERDGALVGFNATIVRWPGYWATFVLRHPAGGLEVVRHRLRKLPVRVAYRRENRKVHAQTVAPEPGVDLPDELVERISRRLPEAGGPRPGEKRLDTALTLFVYVAPDGRGHNVGAGMYRELLRLLPAFGIRRLTASFSRADPAAARMHGKLPFDVYRVPGGYWATLDVAAAASPS